MYGDRSYDWGTFTFRPESPPPTCPRVGSGPNRSPPGGARCHGRCPVWARHDVRTRAGGIKRFDHPLVGDLTLDYESFSINSAPGQTLVVYHADPASPAREMLALLTTLIDTRADGGASPGSASSEPGGAFTSDHDD